MNLAQNGSLLVQAKSRKEAQTREVATYDVRAYMGLYEGLVKQLEI